MTKRKRTQHCTVSCLRTPTHGPHPHWVRDTRTYEHNQNHNNRKTPNQQQSNQSTAAWAWHSPSHPITSSNKHDLRSIWPRDAPWHKKIKQTHYTQGNVRTTCGVLFLQRRLVWTALQASGPVYSMRAVKVHSIIRSLLYSPYNVRVALHMTCMTHIRRSSHC